ncbi:hypothetical protein Q73A0000_09105 [Kaistella flava (ex Peng et al. 2021)]|uniref:Uncharacterized protein n=1 Tax=Kaistella flava (ex Peng et al. 2021) TaxID=2038776 RepID=A0A7M2YA45_9FLAO|nr:hypothetical protein [Kaistella flava (ex Peng et al. 2021)]QOW10515.1 hypothetical protein Q73A0000_09105 [Kaistella flava (ex Peng et al. 2021)]
MKLENKSYPKDFRNALIGLLHEKQENLDQYDEEENEEIKRIEENIFILEKGIKTEYNKVNIDIEDHILNSDEISEVTFIQVQRILRLFFELDGFIKTEEQIRNHPKVFKLKFQGFNDHDDEELDNGQVIVAEYLIMKQKKFQQYKGIFREGKGNVMERYIEIINFFENRKINTSSIIEYLDS